MPTITYSDGIIDLHARLEPFQPTHNVKVESSPAKKN
jgi:hypothetical protein